MEKCNVTARKLCKMLDCESCFKKSFAGSDKAKFWSDENELKPRDVLLGSRNNYLFDCRCGHRFKGRLDHIICGHWCAYCANKKLCDSNECIICYKKSVASHKMKICWSKQNKLKPRDVFLNSGTKYYFDCNICNHSFKNMPIAINREKRWCPFCANQKLCENIKCEVCYKKSFASQKHAIHWSKENIVSPRAVFKCSNIKYKFDCPKCGEIYKAMLTTITTNNSWCSCTKHKTEGILYDFLKTNYKTKIKKQKKFEWCKNILSLPFDFFIKDIGLLIELDGPQHFKQIMNWKSPKETRKLDKHKMNLANKYGYSIIRIYQPDVFSDKNDWQNKLKVAIKKYDIPTKIYIGDIYDESNFLDIIDIFDFTMVNYEKSIDDDKEQEKSRYKEYNDLVNLFYE